MLEELSVYLMSRECKGEKKNGHNIKVVMVYIPPRTNIWLAHLHEEVLKDTLDTERDLITIHMLVIYMEGVDNKDLILT